LKFLLVVHDFLRGNREQGTGNREQGTGNREQGRSAIARVIFVGWALLISKANPHFNVESSAHPTFVENSARSQINSIRLAKKPGRLIRKEIGKKTLSPSSSYYCINYRLAPN
jgi:hypothetical protein